jgi:hypothetical protein
LLLNGNNALGTKETSERVSLLASAISTHYLWNNDCKLAISNMNICVKRNDASNKFNIDRICI